MVPADQHPPRRDKANPAHLAAAVFASLQHVLRRGTHPMKAGSQVSLSSRAQGRWTPLWLDSERTHSAPSLFATAFPLCRHNRNRVLSGFTRWWPSDFACYMKPPRCSSISSGVLVDNAELLTLG